MLQGTIFPTLLKIGLPLMDNGLAMVAAAVVAAVGAVVVALIQTLRKENREDHAVVQNSLAVLSRIAIRTENKVDTVKSELEEHLQSHKGDLGGEVGRTVKKRGQASVK